MLTAVIERQLGEGPKYTTEKRRETAVRALPNNMIAEAGTEWKSYVLFRWCDECVGGCAGVWVFHAVCVDLHCALLLRSTRTRTIAVRACVYIKHAPVCHCSGLLAFSSDCVPCQPITFHSLIFLAFSIKCDERTDRIQQRQIFYIERRGRCRSIRTFRVQTLVNVH